MGKEIEGTFPSVVPTWSMGGKVHNRKNIPEGTIIAGLAPHCNRSLQTTSTHRRGEETV